MEKSRIDKNRKRFLIIATTGTGIGDALMGTPAVRALRESFPDSQIDVLINSQRKELFSGNPHVDRILGYRNNWLYRALLFLKTFPARYDHVLVFHANEDIWKILRMIRYTECRNRQGFEDAARRMIPLGPLPQHSVRKRMALVEAVGGKKSSNFRYDYFLSPDSIRWAKDKLKEWGISSNDKLVGIQIGAADAYKCWPLESFVEVARSLQANLGVKIYLNISSGEKGLIRKFVSYC